MDLDEAVHNFHKKVKTAPNVRPAFGPAPPLASSPRLPSFPSSSPRLLRARQGALSGFVHWAQEVSLWGITGALCVVACYFFVCFVLSLQYIGIHFAVWCFQRACSVLFRTSEDPKSLYLLEESVWNPSVVGFGPFWPDPDLISYENIIDSGFWIWPKSRHIFLVKEKNISSTPIFVYSPKQRKALDVFWVVRMRWKCWILNTDGSGPGCGFRSLKEFISLF
jgi:hypothetical protein